jgi:DNA-binding transcriptional MocR family regulator
MQLRCTCGREGTIGTWACCGARSPLSRRALEQGFSIAPGPIFSARREFAHCLRLNYGHEWTLAGERAIKALGALERG